MARDLILGTAGHIDHGKTALVKALTGVDCDRLPEEKKRGITIDIGFAFLDLGDFRLGVVDVPGHERFIRNMLAGAASIDLALLVVSAVESVKPQTREHLEILNLLGLRRGIVALTKCDLVDATTREVAALEVRDLLRDSLLKDAPIVSVSAVTGAGLDELREALRRECSQIEEHTRTLPFRMPIDRCFVVQGHGAVVTGSVVSGSLRVGEEVEWLPRRERVRVRALHSHDRPVEEVHRGQRAALNLAGVAHEEVHRGQEVAALGYLVPSRVVTVRLHSLASVRRPLRHRANLRLHIGAAETMGDLALLDCDEIRPGGWGFAQLFLAEPIVAVWGQPFVVRDPSAEHTLGGGQILQPIAGKIRRRHFEVIEHVEKLAHSDPRARAEAAAWFTAWQGLHERDLVREAGLDGAAAGEAIAMLRTSGQLTEIAVGARRLLLDSARLRELQDRILAVLGTMHADAPLLTMHERAKVVAQLDYVGDDALLQAVIDDLIAGRKLVGDAKRLARADFKPSLSVNQRKLKDRIVEAHRVAGFQPPEPSSFAPQAGGNAAALHDIYEVAVAEGLLTPIAGEIYLHSDAESEMRRRVAERLAVQPEGLTVAEIRDLLATTRKYAVPLCEYLDRVGVTCRDGDLRRANRG